MYSAITAPKIIINYWNWTTHTLSYNGTLSRTTQVGQYQKKHSPTHTHPVHQASFINFLHLLRSIASSLYNLRARHSFSKTSLQVLFGLPLGLGPPTSYSMHFFTQSSSFCSTCPCHLIFFPYRPGLTSMQYTASHTGIGLLLS